MDTWFNSPERVLALENAASSWIGTPFVANSRCKGVRGGVSCQMLAEQIYKESGVPFDFQAPEAPMRWSNTSADSLIMSFLTEHPELVELLDNPTDSDILPGDLLGFRVGSCVHHVGVVLTGNKFIHCMRGMRTLICYISDPTFKRRLACLWRIKP